MEIKNQNYKRWNGFVSKSKNNGLIKFFNSNDPQSPSTKYGDLYYSLIMIVASKLGVDEDALLTSVISFDGSLDKKYNEMNYTFTKKPVVTNALETMKELAGFIIDAAVQISKQDLSAIKKEIQGAKTVTAIGWILGGISKQPSSTYVANRTNQSTYQTSGTLDSTELSSTKSPLQDLFSLWRNSKNLEKDLKGQESKKETPPVPFHQWKKSGILNFLKCLTVDLKGNWSYNELNTEKTGRRKIVQNINEELKKILEDKTGLEALERIRDSFVKSDTEGYRTLSSVIDQFGKQKQYTDFTYESFSPKEGKLSHSDEFPSQQTQSQPKQSQLLDLNFSDQQPQQSQPKPQQSQQTQSQPKPQQTQSQSQPKSQPQQSQSQYNSLDEIDRLMEELLEIQGPSKSKTTSAVVNVNSDLTKFSTSAENLLQKLKKARDNLNECMKQAYQSDFQRASNSRVDIALKVNGHMFDENDKLVLRQGANDIAKGSTDSVETLIMDKSTLNGKLHKAAQEYLKLREQYLKLTPKDQKRSDTPLSSSAKSNVVEEKQNITQMVAKLNNEFATVNTKNISVPKDWQKDGWGVELVQGLISSIKIDNNGNLSATNPYNESLNYIIKNKPLNDQIKEIVDLVSDPEKQSNIISAYNELAAAKKWIQIKDTLETKVTQVSKDQLLDLEFSSQQPQLQPQPQPKQPQLQQDIEAVAKQVNSAIAKIENENLVTKDLDKKIVTQLKFDQDGACYREGKKLPLEEQSVERTKLLSIIKVNTPCHKAIEKLDELLKKKSQSESQDSSNDLFFDVNSSQNWWDNPPLSNQFLSFSNTCEEKATNSVDKLNKALAAITEADISISDKSFALTLLKSYTFKADGSCLKNGYDCSKVNALSNINCYIAVNHPIHQVVAEFKKSLETNPFIS
jgi:hypothetical protein